MIAAFDVHYPNGGGAIAAAVTFIDFESPQPVGRYIERLGRVEDYEPGQFYRRELPCLLAVIEKIREPVTMLIVDGYVTLGEKPGLGLHLYHALDDGRPVIGVAKSAYAEGQASEVYRGKSERPLFVTAVGIEQEEAAGHIASMHGPHRTPTLLREVDRLCRAM